MSLELVFDVRGRCKLVAVRTKANVSEEVTLLGILPEHSLEGGLVLHHEEWIGKSEERSVRPTMTFERSPRLDTLFGPVGVV